MLFTFNVILPTAPLFVSENLTLTVAPALKVNAVVVGVMVATFAVVAAAVAHVAYHADWLSALFAVVFAALAVELALLAVTVSVVICFDERGGSNISHSVNAVSDAGSTNFPRIMSVASAQVQVPPTAVGVGKVAYFHSLLYQTI